MANQYERHPACAVWGDLDNADYARLRESMEENGFDPAFPIEIILHPDGGGRFLVLDGWNRHMAADDVGVPAKYKTLSIKHDDHEAIAHHVITRNAARRHLSKARVADLAVQTMKAAGGELPTGKAVTPKTITKKKVAKEAGVSEETAKRAIARAKKPPAPPSPAQVKKKARAKGKEFASANKAKRADRDTIDTLKEANEQYAHELSEKEAELAAANAAAADGENADAVADAVAEYKRAVKDKDRVIAKQAREIDRLKKQVAGLTAERDEFKKYAAEMEKALAKQGA